MTATFSPGYLITRSIQTILHYLHLDHLGLVGLALAIGLSNLVSQRVDSFGLSMLDVPSVAASINAHPTSPDADNAGRTSMAASMRAALDYVSRRYRVSAEALVPIFETAEVAGRERHLEPNLLLAVISIESGFNPYSQSELGAQGLMQIIPRFHLDKVPHGSGEMPFLDPTTNIRIGARILQESIRRNGNIMSGLQQYAGAADDEGQAYANKVMAEKQRLDQASRRGSRAGA